MERKRLHGMAVTGVFLAALILKLYFSTQEPLIHNIDAGYYVQHIQEVLDTGFPQVIDPPLAFYYAAAFVSVFGMMLGFKIAIALVSAGIALPAYKIARHISGSVEVGLLAAFLAAFSPTNMFMMGDLLKNELGLFFGAWFVYYLIRTTDSFSFRSAALSSLFALLMVGSHFSASGYIVFSIVPFLAILAADRYRSGEPFGKEHLYCLFALAGLAIAGLGVIILKGWDLSSLQIGVVGLYWQGSVSFQLFEDYSLFIVPAVLGLVAIDRRRKMLLVPWVVVSFLLTQTFFAKPEFAFRFGWDSYVLVALLSSLGIGYLIKDRRAFLAVSIILAVVVLAGFVKSGQSTSPVIELDEWEGLVALHGERPDIVFTPLGMGLSYWVHAAGFETSPEGDYALVCLDEPGREQNRWLAEACSGATAVVPSSLEGEIPGEARFGRFMLVRSAAIPDEFRRREPPDLNPPPQ